MPCTDKNPLIREGTSLLSRVLAALSAGYAKVDERDAGDIILFAKKYASFLNYYDDTNAVDGDWQLLMSSDVSVALATLAKTDVREISDYKKRIYKNIKLASNDADAKLQFKYLFDLLFSLVKIVDDQFQLLPDDFEYKNILVDVIKNKLQPSLGNLVGYFNDFSAQNELDYSVEQLDNDAPINVISDQHFDLPALSKIWNAPFETVPITDPPALPAKDFIVYIINHNLFNAQVESLLNGISSVVNRANDLFVETLGDSPNHAPHFALFLAFIQIYKNAQDELNQYTQAHLDFYYKQVLQLINQAPQPDSAHLLFALQKNIDDHLLTKNTLFKGGKDITGTEITYSLTDDVVITNAAVSLLHSQQIIRDDQKDLLKSSSIANSDDGQIAKLTTPDKNWFTFGDPAKIKNAKAGFAIASNILFLNEGSRTITITVNFKASLPGSLNFSASSFTAQFTGKKKWESIFQPSCIFSSNKQLVFTLILKASEPAIVPYSEKIHLQNMNVALPVLEIFLDQDVANSIPYTFLCDKEIVSVEIDVAVEGVKNLMLSSDGGAVDASKPFKPFGTFPDTGAGFYIGSKEIFQKNLSQVDLITDWKIPPNAAQIPIIDTTAYYLYQNNYDSRQYNLSVSNTSLGITFPVNAFSPAAIDFTANEKLSATTIEGFLRIKLADNEDKFSLTAHLKSVSANLSNTTIIKSPTSPLTYTFKLPATPVPIDAILNSFSINYEASSEISFQSDSAPANNLFYHLGAFGFSVVNELLSDRSADLANTTKFTLLQDIESEGELYIGLANADPNSVINILFQVADGTSNPLLNIEMLNWYYLAANNSWVIFKEEDIVDSTNNFTQSGIVILTLPDDIDNNSTILENGFYWIKVTAHPNTDAVCKMILIQAQAARVQLVQDDTKKIEFRQLLPANSISKLVVSDAAIKTISQPFDSFDGRTRESDVDFYVRVSERLRHKQRAITIWDYEHIVLQNFQKIFKVKCINQAGFYKDNGDDVFCENFPGHVSVITIPNQNNCTILDPLRPYTPIGLLTNINDYLKTVTSPFVKLHVKNPQFEEIQLDFEVTFYNGKNPDFYKKMLNDDIEKFLCPWAFGNTAEISFGGKIYKSTLINFVEERPYVDFVTCFKMNQFIDRGGKNPKALPDIEEAVASTARSILVSYHDGGTRHLIVPPANCTC